MTRVQHVPTDEYRVRFAAHSGLSPYDLRDHLTRAEARRVLARALRRRRQSGHPVLVLAAGTEYEICEPDGCQLVPDTVGILWLERHTVPAVECRDCGSLVRVGDCCDCHEEISE